MALSWNKSLCELDTEWGERWENASVEQKPSGNLATEQVVWLSQGARLGLFILGKKRFWEHLILALQ